jgi:hypothetical protein
MATHSFAEIDIPEAAKLESLMGMSYDLQQAKAFALRLKSILADGRLDRDLIEPLWIAAVVQYFRTFGGGVRQNLNEILLDSLTREQRQGHDWLYELRGRHVVHSVNTFEHSQTIARYVVEDVKDKGITAIECNHYRVIGPSLLDVDGLIALADTLLKGVDSLAREEKARLLTVVRRMPLDTVLAGRTKDAYQPDMDRPERRRNS